MLRHKLSYIKKKDIYLASNFVVCVVVPDLQRFLFVF